MKTLKKTLIIVLAFVDNENTKYHVSVLPRLQVHGDF